VEVRNHGPGRSFKKRVIAGKKKKERLEREPGERGQVVRGEFAVCGKREKGKMRNCLQPNQGKRRGPKTQKGGTQWQTQKSEELATKEVF